MKDTLSKVSDLARMSMHDLKKSLSLLKLVTLIDAMNGENHENGEDDLTMVVDIPMFGKLRISDDFDFDFIPNLDFKKEVYQIKQNPKAYLVRELRKVLKLSAATTQQKVQQDLKVSEGESTEDNE